MGLKTFITDIASGLKARVDNNNNKETNALVVATRPLKTYNNKIKFFLNPDYGVDMNQDASTGGTPEKVHDGIDSSLWTASDIIGGAKTTFNSSDQAHAGSTSIKVDNSPIGDIFQLNKGSDLDCTGYVSLTLWVYVDKDWAEGDNIILYGWDTGTGQQVGNSVNLEDHFDWGTFDSWHKISISLNEFGALASYTALDALRIQIIAKDGKSPKFYLDDIQFEETGTPIIFKVEPDKKTWLWIDSIKITMVDAHSGITAVADATENATLPNLAYNKLLGLAALNVGLIFSVFNEKQSVFSRTIEKLIDILQLPGSEIIGYGGDGTNAWLSIKFNMSAPFLLKSEDIDYMSVTISEDISGLLFMRWAAGCREEIR